MNPYGPCFHTKYEGCPPCVHSAWDEGVQAARDAVAASKHGGPCYCNGLALAAIDALNGEQA